MENNKSNLDIQKERFEKIRRALSLYDPTLGYTRVRRYEIFNKEKLRRYMENPNRYAKELRAVSRFLATRSQVYRKIIEDNANMIDTRFKQIIPNINFLGENNMKKVEKSFYETAQFLNLMNLPSEMLKVYKECWTCDVFFGVYYFYKGEGGIMMPLDPDYCKITGIYPTGDFCFSFDTRYFQNHKEEIDLWGEPFTSMYRESSKKNGDPWQPVPDQYACCMKIGLEDFLVAIPPYITLFDALVNLEDLREILSIDDANMINQLICYKLETFNNSNTPDDFTVELDTAVQYYNKSLEVLPDNVSAIISPLPVEEVNLSHDHTGEINKVENASKNILKAAGHSALADPNGATAMAAALKADEDYAISSLIPQTQAWVNRMVSYYVKNPSKVKFLEVTKYSKQEFKDSIIKDMNYGLPMITTLGVLNGYSETEIFALAKMNDHMNIRELFKPFATASTQSGDDGSGESKVGRPKGDVVTDDAEKSAEKRDSAG